MGNEISRVQLYITILKGREIGNADARSRLPVPSCPQAAESTEPKETIQFLQQLESSPVLAKDIRKWTVQDPILSHVQYYVSHGWPKGPGEEALKPYLPRGHELSMD